MSNHHDDHHGKWEKHCCTAARNKRHNLINLMAWQHEAVAAGGLISAPTPDTGKPQEHLEQDEDGNWVERSEKVRNRLTGKRKKAKGRWAGFASASGGPSKGR